MAPPRKPMDEVATQRSPAKTPEARENQLIAAAIDLAEKQILKGTASAQVITHYLKLGTTTHVLEKEQLQKKNELLTAQVEALASAKRMEDLYAEAIKAMASYSGKEEHIEGEIIGEDDVY